MGGNSRELLHLPSRLKDSPQPFVDGELQVISKTESIREAIQLGLPGMAAVAVYNIVLTCMSMVCCIPDLNLLRPSCALQSDASQAVLDNKQSTVCQILKTVADVRNYSSRLEESQSHFLHQSYGCPTSFNGLHSHSPEWQSLGCRA